MANIFAYSGNYYVDKIYYEKGKKSFWGTGFKLETAHIFQNDKIDLKLGGRLSLLFEDGQFRRFRRDPELKGFLETDRGDYHPSGLQYMFGFTGGITYKGSWYKAGLSAHAGIDPMLVIIFTLPEIQAGLNLHFTVNNDVTFTFESSQSRISGLYLKTGLYYRL